MPIIVNSPFSGKPVKVRDQDVGRSVRDEEGRVFYVLQRSDGNGYYSSPTRQGGLKDEQRYDRMAGKSEQMEESVQEQIVMHDATGRRRSSLRGKLVILVLVIIVVLLVLYTKTNLLDKWKKPPPAGTMPVSLIETDSIGVDCTGRA